MEVVWMPAFLVASIEDGVVDLTVVDARPAPVAGFALAPWGTLGPPARQLDESDLFNGLRVKFNGHHLDVIGDASGIHCSLTPALGRLEPFNGRPGWAAYGITAVVDVVTIDVRRPGSDVRHRLLLLDRVGMRHPLPDASHDAPSLAHTIATFLTVPWVVEVECPAATMNDAPLTLRPKAVDCVLAHFRSQLPSDTRNKHPETDLRPSVTALMAGLETALAVYAPVLQHLGNEVHLQLETPSSIARIVSRWAPGASSLENLSLVLEARLPHPVERVAIARAGIQHIVANWRDTKCGHRQVDDTFVIRGDEAVATMIADVASHWLLNLAEHDLAMVIEGETLTITLNAKRMHRRTTVACVVAMTAIWAAVVDALVGGRSGRVGKGHTPLVSHRDGEGG